MLALLHASRLTRNARPPVATRGDIQGLRALAVLLVIANHVFGGPAGGFVGVDMAFVVSGFLITQLLVREHRRTGSISYVDFYRRRVRRIVPVATLVLAATVVATFALFSVGRGRDVLTDGGWAFAFLANWHFADVGTDYFAAGGPISPLQHYWALSVEEQFYVVWPTLLVAALWLGRRARGGARPGRVLVGVAAGATLLSLGYSFVHSGANPTAAYFSTFDRAWELGVGAVLAVSAHRLTALPDRLRPLLAWVGLALVAAGVLLIDERSRFPAPGALLPVVGTLIVIAAGTGVDAPNRYLAPLVNPVSRYLGDISYSLYLWHFPVVVLGLAYYPAGGGTYRIVVLLVTAALSVISYHLVEDPVRHSRWLEPRWRRVLVVGPTNHRHRVANGWMVVALVTVVTLTTLALQAPSRNTDAEVLAVAPSGPGAVQGDAPGGPRTAKKDTQDYLQDRLAQSLDFEEFPTLKPDVDSLGLNRWFVDAQEYGCVSVTPENLDACRFGKPDSENTAVVLGDSFAIAYMPAVREALGGTFSVQQLTFQECPAFEAGTNHFSGAAYPECAQFKKWAFDEIQRLDPDLVIVASSYTYASLTMSSGATGSAAFDEIESGLEKTLDAVGGPGRLVVTLAPPPGAGDLQQCVTAVGSTADCVKPPPPDWIRMTEAEQQAAEATGTAYLDTEKWFCVGGSCPAFAGNTPVFVDGGHLTEQYAKQLGPVMHDALSELGNRYRKAHPTAAATGGTTRAPVAGRGGA